MPKAKKLFITHNTGMIGGANKSLRELIKNLDEKVDMIAPIDYSVSNQKLKKFFGTNIDNIYRYDLPSRSSISGYDNTLIKWLESEIKYLKNKTAIYKFIVNGGYEFVHLNSYVLYPLLNKKIPMYIHVRERFNGNIFSKQIVKKNFKHATGVIYIDYSVKSALNIECKKQIVLNNPFNQRSVLDVDLEQVCQKYKISDKETIYLFVTDQLLEIKGLEFCVDAFIESGCKNTKLLIAGVNSIGKYKKYDNIKFLGKVKQMDELYAVSDYVLRGEPYFAIGRTVYEGLFSGCSVIVPGDINKDKMKMFAHKYFNDNIFMYKPRDFNELVNIFKKNDGIKKRCVLGLSNEKKYINKLKKFIEEK